MLVKRTLVCVCVCACVRACVCVGITDAAIMPLLALLVDTRHDSFYGCVYAIVQLAVCLAYAVGKL